jgi:hypothetical protein
MSETDHRQPKTPALTGKEKTMIGIEGVLMAIPFVGPSLRAFCFRAVDRVTIEARGRKFEGSCRSVGRRKSKIHGQ